MKFSENLNIQLQNIIDECNNIMDWSHSLNSEHKAIQTTIMSKVADIQDTLDELSTQVQDAFGL